MKPSLVHIQPTGCQLWDGFPNWSGNLNSNTFAKDPQIMRVCHVQGCELTALHESSHFDPYYVLTPVKHMKKVFRKELFLVFMARQ
jgi:hypothetical protein